MKLSLNKGYNYENKITYPRDCFWKQDMKILWNLLVKITNGCGFLL